jgi:hypothetical protein
VAGWKSSGSAHALRRVQTIDDLLGVAGSDKTASASSGTAPAQLRAECRSPAADLEEMHDIVPAQLRIKGSRHPCARPFLPCWG